MPFVIELEGPIVDVRRRWYEAHRLVQGEMGLARRDRDEFWRLIRRGAELAEIVRPTRAGQLPDYARRFEQAVVAESLLELDEPQPDVGRFLAALNAVGRCDLVVPGPQRAAAQRLLDEHELWRFFGTLRMLSPDRSVRRSQLGELLGQGGQGIAVVGSDALVRAARDVEALVIGLSNGACTPKRLRQSGADVVLGDLGDVVEAVRTPDEALLRAGYRPPRPEG